MDFLPTTEVAPSHAHKHAGGCGAQQGECHHLDVVDAEREKSQKGPLLDRVLW